ncbi:MAG: MFS transporter [Bacteroidota bacterium]
MLNDKKTIHAWCMYDWANSVYSLTITSAIFPIYFQSVAVSETGTDMILFFGIEFINSVLYSYALSASFLLVALVLPLLSGIADYTGQKKNFLRGFMILGSVSCVGLFFFTGDNIEWGILCSVFASVGYSGSLVFYDAFLSEIVTEDRRDIVSAKGYSYGYIGGVIMLVANLVIIEFYDSFGLPGKGIATRLAFLMVGIWWFGFSQYALAKLPGEKRGALSSRYILNGYKELQTVWKQLTLLPILKRFLLAFFFYNMGVQTIMYLAATFGSKELQMADDKLILTILLIQFLAVAGSYIFAGLSKRRGNTFSLLTMIVIWIGCCFAAYAVTVEMEFFILAAVVGLVMGGIQSLSRATYSKIIPGDTIDTASFYSFYDVTYNLAIVFGTFIYGFVEQVTGSMRNSALALASFFIIGMLFLIGVKIRKQDAGLHAAAKST